MIGRLKLALKIILGYDIIIYDINTKKVHSIINGSEDIITNHYDYAIDKYITENNGEMRYLK